METETQANPLVIRKMTPHDIEAVLEIDRKCGSTLQAIHYINLRTIHLTNEIKQSLVAVKNNKVIGVILVRTAHVVDLNINAAVIELVLVDPAHWKQGLSTKLIEELTKSCEKQNLPIVWASSYRREFRKKVLYSSHLTKYTQYVND